MKPIKLNILFFLILSACSTKRSEKTEEYNTMIICNQTNKIIDKSLLLGVWWNADDKNAPTVIFEINDSTICYPDQDGKFDCNYRITRDSLLINQSGYILYSKIEKLTKDTLELVTEGEKQTLIKTEYK